MNVTLKNLKKTCLGNLKDTKAFIEYSNSIQNVYKNIKEYNPRRKCVVLIDQREQGTIISLRWNKPHQCFLVNFGA